MDKHAPLETGIPEVFLKFKPEFTVLSPGRINLIGEHTDYNNGYVLPTAIGRTIRLQFARNTTESTCNIYSRSLNKSLRVDLKKVARSENLWENYVLGVINEIQKLGNEFGGFDCIIESDIPSGAGLSSSAALECGMAYGINRLFDLGLDLKTMAQLSQEAEHDFVGTQCGIMDQYASMLSKRDHLILLDCRDLNAAYVPAHFGEYQLLLLNSMVSHKLSESHYNQRRKECEEVVAVMDKDHPEIQSLREVSFDILEAFKTRLTDLQYRRALYVLQENDRVLQAVKALKNGDMENLGNLLYDSHLGLRDDFEVSCPELDFLVDFSKDFEAVLGARMMGGGFGGCTINLVRQENIVEFTTQVSAAYYSEYGIKLQAFPVLPQDGTSILQ